VNVSEKKGKKKKEKKEKREREKTREQGHDWFPQIEEVEDLQIEGEKKEKKKDKKKEHRQLKGMRCPAKSQIRDASGVRLLLLSSTSPIAAASSCYLQQRCTGFDATLVKQASKPEAKRSTRAHKHAQKGSPILSGTQTHSKAS
jgi:hypothetical protein